MDRRVAFRLRQDCVGGAKANAVQQFVGQRATASPVLSSVRSKGFNYACRAFADELAVKCFASADVGAQQFPFTKGSLRDPRGRDRRRTANERSKNSLPLQ